MADQRIYGTNTIQPSTGNGWILQQGTRQGAAFSADWRQQFIIDGRAYFINVGAFSTPITGGGAGTIIDQDQPEACISIPSGTSLIPIRIDVQCQIPLLATDADECEILLAADRLAAGTAGTSTSETALNMRSDNPRTSLCTCYSAYTGNATNPTLGLELARVVTTGDVQGTPTTALWTPLSLLCEPVNPPILVGPAALYIYFGGTVAVSGFAQAFWVEFPTTWIA
jgi:hypothetical protein